MGKLFVDFTTEELVSYLIRNFKLNLCIFAISLARCLRTYMYPIFPIQDYLDLRNKILKFKQKAKIIERDLNRIFGYAHHILSNNLYDRDDNLGIYLADIKCQLLDKRRGAKIKPRNKIVLVWASYFQDEYGKVPWSLLAKLLDWFWEKLKNYKIYKYLDPGPWGSNPDYLKNQYYKHKMAGSDLIKNKITRDNLMGRFQWDRNVFEELTRDYDTERRLGLRRINVFAADGLYDLSVSLFLQYISYIMDDKSRELEIDVPQWSKSVLDSLYKYLLPKLFEEHDPQISIFLPRVVFPDYTFLL